MAIPFCARFIEPSEPRVPVRVSVLFTGTIDVVETVIAKLPVCTPFALPERLNVAFSVGAAAKQAVDPLKLNWETLIALPFPCASVAVNVKASDWSLFHAWAIQNPFKVLGGASTACRQG